METLSATTSTPIFDSIMSTPSDSHYLKMEDVHASSSASPAPSTFDNGSVSQSSPPPVLVASRSAKKRKSWGQELPEPKTTLPPRKRAKTDDEKEQRRIERIKRNRAAAHNSRERKRQETENLAVLLAKANAELDAYKKLHGPLPASVVLPEVQLYTLDSSEQTQTSVATPAPSLVESHGSIQDEPSPASPAHEDMFPTQIKEEPSDNTPFTMPPPAFDSLDSKPSLLLPLDPTQHSAAMLCDLQCRSSSKSSSSQSTSTTLTAAATWAHLILSLMSAQFMTCYRTFLVALWTISPSRMARMMQASANRSSRLTTSSMTPLLLRSTRRRLARLNAATGLSAPNAQRQSSHEGRTLGTQAVSSAQARSHQTRLALQEDQAEREHDDLDEAQGVSELT